MIVLMYYLWYTTYILMLKELFNSDYRHDNIVIINLYKIAIRM